MQRPILASLQSLFGLSDEQAMWRVRTHDDERAFAGLVRRWEGPIQRLCTRMTGDAETGKDLAQETFARVFARRKDYQPNGKFSTWLWRIALNLSYDELRRRCRRDEWPLDAPDAISALELCAAPDHSLLREERGEFVRRALERLPEGQRTVLVLRHYENLKFREIAELLDLPEGTVKSRMADALTRMTQLLKASLQDHPAHALKTEHQTKESYL